MATGEPTYLRQRNAPHFGIHGPYLMATHGAAMRGGRGAARITRSRFQNGLAPAVAWPREEERAIYDSVRVLFGLKEDSFAA